MFFARKAIDRLCKGAVASDVGGGDDRVEENIESGDEGAHFWGKAEFAL